MCVKAICLFSAIAVAAGLSLSGDASMAMDNAPPGPASEASAASSLPAFIEEHRLPVIEEAYRSALGLASTVPAPTELGIAPVSVVMPVAAAGPAKEDQDTKQLAAEVRQKAEELSERFTGGGGTTSEHEASAELAEVPETAPEADAAGGKATAEIAEAQKALSATTKRAQRVAAKVTALKNDNKTPAEGAGKAGQKPAPSSKKGTAPLTAGAIQKTAPVTAAPKKPLPPPSGLGAAPAQPAPPSTGWFANWRSLEMPRELGVFTFGEN